MNEEPLTPTEEDRAPRRQRRRLARELALKGTYQWLLSDNPLAQIEAQLAHAVKDANGRAYNRTEFVEQRRTMLQAWANYLDTLRTGAQVIPLVKVA